MLWLLGLRSGYTGMVAGLTGPMLWLLGLRSAYDGLSAGRTGPVAWLLGLRSAYGGVAAGPDLAYVVALRTAAGKLGHGHACTNRNTHAPYRPPQIGNRQHRATIRQAGKPRRV